MSNHGIALAQRQVGTFGAEVDSWQEDHRAAMRCMDVEAILRVGNAVFSFVTWIDDELSLASLKGELEELSPEALREQLHNLYRAWLRPCDAVELAVRRCEADGFEVEGAEEFRSARREAQGVLTPDAEFFRGDELVVLRDQAVEDARAGRVEPLVDAPG